MNRFMRQLGAVCVLVGIYLAVGGVIYQISHGWGIPYRGFVPEMNAAMWIAAGALCRIAGRSKP